MVIWTLKDRYKLRVDELQITNAGERRTDSITNCSTDSTSLGMSLLLLQGIVVPAISYYYFRIGIWQR